MKLQAIIATGALTVITSVSTAIAGPGDHGDGSYGHMMWGGGPGWWGPVAMLLFWAAIIAVAVFAIRAFAGGRGPGSPDPLDMLKERYARGEIDEEEFRRRKQELQS